MYNPLAGSSCERVLELDRKNNEICFDCTHWIKIRNKLTDQSEEKTCWKIISNASIFQLAV